MSEQTTGQPELGGMPDPEPVKILWLHLAEAGSEEIATAALILANVADIPSLPEGDADLFTMAAERLARACMQQIGLRAWDHALDQADKTLINMLLGAQSRRKKETTERYR